MPFFTIGEDSRATVIGPYGAIDLPEATTITIKSGAKVVEFQDLNGNTNTRTVISNGTSVEISFARVDNTIEVMLAQMIANWKAGVPIPKGSATIITSEGNGTETTTLCSPISWKPDLGSNSPGKTVMQKLTGTAEGYSVV